MSPRRPSARPKRKRISSASGSASRRTPTVPPGVNFEARWLAVVEHAKGVVTQFRVGLPFPVHTHMLRHGCGYALANAGHDTRAIQAWLGHANILHTVRYTELGPQRFASFWT